MLPACELSERRLTHQPQERGKESETDGRVAQPRALRQGSLFLGRAAIGVDRQCRFGFGHRRDLQESLPLMQQRANNLPPETSVQPIEIALPSVAKWLVFPNEPRSGRVLKIVQEA